MITAHRITARPRAAMTTRPTDTRRRNALRRLARDWRAWLAAIAALYTIAGFLVVPPVAKHQVQKQVRALLGCEASVRSLRFNPYTFNTRARGFALSDRRGGPLLSFDELFVNFAPWPLTRKVVAVEEVRLRGPRVAIRIREDGTINLLDLVPVPAADGTEAAPEGESAFLMRVDRVAVSAATITFDDATTEPDASAAIDSLDLTATGYRSAPGDTTFFETTFFGRAGGMARAGGWVMPAEVIVHARVDVDSLALTPADPYLARFAYLDLRSGKLAVHGDIHAVATPPGPPAIEFSGDIVSDDLRLHDALKDQEFFGYRRLSVLSAQAKSVPPAARVDEIALSGIYARIAIAADGSFNVKDVFAPAIAAADSMQRAKAGGVAPDTAAAAPLPDIAIGRVRIDGGEVDFSDLSLPLPFASRVHSVTGVITALSPDNAAGSKVLIEGTVDEHGFAKATGFVNAFDPVAFTDLDVGFRNIELTDMTPYSGKFMGYRIKRGKLSLGLEYDIKQGRLKGDNRILLERLTLGEKVESPDAVGLPIKLAIALLKDKNGNIDLDLEVEGDLNDPKVNTADLVWQALKKVIVKITTAPFRFLGNLLGIGGDEMEFVEFETGRKNLTPPQHERLGHLARALVERPQLKLQVRGAFDKTGDAAALREQRFEELLMSRLLAAAGGDSTAARAIASDPAGGRMQGVLEALTAEAFGAAALPAMRAEHTKVPAEGGEPRLDLATYFQAMRGRLIAAQGVEEAELVALATERAGAIRGYLVEMQRVAPERVEAAENETHEDGGEWVRCRLSLDGSE
jgi:hypothetical protein